MARAGRKSKSSVARVTWDQCSKDPWPQLMDTNSWLCGRPESKGTPPSRHLKLTNQQLLQMSYIFKQNQLSWAIKQFSSSQIHCSWKESRLKTSCTFPQKTGVIIHLHWRWHLKWVCSTWYPATLIPQNISRLCRTLKDLSETRASLLHSYGLCTEMLHRRIPNSMLIWFSSWPYFKAAGIVEFFSK